MHVTDAIGIDRPKNMSSIAQTVGHGGNINYIREQSGKKGYVVQNRSSKDRRAAFISFPEKELRLIIIIRSFMNR